MNLSHQLTALIIEMREQITLDTEDGTLIPSWYEEIYWLLDKAEQYVQSGEYYNALEIIGDINLETLDQVDAYDDVVWVIIEKMRTIQEKYVSSWEKIPLDLQKALQHISTLLNPRTTQLPLTQDTTTHIQ